MSDAQNSRARPESAQKTQCLSTRVRKYLTEMESGLWQPLNTNSGLSERMAVQSMRYRHLKEVLWLKLREMELEDEPELGLSDPR